MNYVRKKSQKQEARTAKEFGGRVTPASGALDGAKGDVKTPLFLIENKYTDCDFYTLHANTWEKIFKEATKDGLRLPLMQIDIQDCELVLGDKYDVIPPNTAFKVMVCRELRGKSIRIKKEWFDEFEVVHFKLQGYTLALIKKQLFLDGQMQT